MKDKIYDFLEDWIIKFLENKDIIAKSIVKIDKGEGMVVITYKTKRQVVFVEPFIIDKDRVIKNIAPSDDFASIVALNTKENFDFMVNNWEQLVKNPKLSIYFVNPFSKLDKKWIIFPHTHNLVSDKATLKQGLLSLFNTVDVLTEEETKKILS